MWTLSENNSHYRHGYKWDFKLRGSLDCLPDYVNTFLFRLASHETHYPTWQKMRQDIACMLRAPWMIYQLYIDDDGTIITQDDFHKWYTENVGDVHTALDTKPSAFLTAHPSWTLNGKEYSTNIFAPLYVKDGNRNDVHKMYFEFHPIFQFRSATTGEYTAYPASQDLFYFHPELQTYGMTVNTWSGTDDDTLTTNPYKTGWNSLFTLSLDPESDTFSDDLDNFAQALFKFQGSGVSFPFCFRTLPEVTNANQVIFTVRVTTFIPGYSSNHEQSYLVHMDLLDSSRPINKTEHESLDWKTWLSDMNQKFLGSCVSHRVVPTPSHKLPTRLGDQFTLVGRFKDAMEMVFYATVGARAAHPTLDSEFHSVITQFTNARNYLYSTHNLNLVKAEGILVLEETIESLKSLRVALVAADIGTTSDHQNWETLENAIDLSVALTEAAADGTWDESYRQRDRPIHVHVQLQQDDVDARVADAVANMEDGSLPTWAEATLISLGVIVFVLAIIVVWQIMRHRSS